jgi:hypothetical protein
MFSKIKELHNKIINCIENIKLNIKLKKLTKDKVNEIEITKSEYIEGDNL